MNITKIHFIVQLVQLLEKTQRKISNFEWFSARALSIKQKKKIAQLYYILKDKLDHDM